MPITSTTVAQGVEEKSSSDRQRRVVSWTYPDLKRQAPSSIIIHPKPPHYQDSLYTDLHVCRDMGLLSRHVQRCRSETFEDEDALELNVDLLVGAKSAEDTLKLYEINAGFYYAEPDSHHPEDRDLCRVITDDEIAAGKDRWAHLVQNLTGMYISPRSRSRQDIKIRYLASPTSSEFFDLTDSEHSEHSVDSDPVPSTPKPGPYMNVTVKQPSPSHPDFSPPGGSLNASASSFIPTSTSPVKVSNTYCPTSRFSRIIPSPSPSPTQSNFTFPSLNSSIQSLTSLPANLKKDDQGFYTEVPRSPMDSRSSSNRTLRSSTTLLPSFLVDPSLRARRMSKTRKIVDQLRSTSVNDFDRPHSRSCIPIRPESTVHQLTLSTAADEGACRLKSDASQLTNASGSAMEDFEEEGDGWLRAEVEENDGDPEAKARRTRDLVQALGRNRPDSTQGSDSDVFQKEAGWEVFSQPSKGSKNSSKDASAPRRKGSRHRSRKTHGVYCGSALSSPSVPPPMSLPLSSISPTQPFFPAYPVYTTAYTYAVSSYKPLQIPTQTHNFPPQVAFAGTPFSSIALYPPIIMDQLQPPISSKNLRGRFNRSGIAGGTGIRHTQW